MHTVLHSFIKEFVTWLIDSDFSLLAFISAEIEKAEVMRDADIGLHRESVYDYFTCQVLDAEESVQTTSSALWREKNVCSASRDAYGLG